MREKNPKLAWVETDWWLPETEDGMGKMGVFKRQTFGHKIDNA